MIKYIVGLFLFLSSILYAQKKEINKVKDSIHGIDEIVVTAQYSKQSIKKSVFDVTVINSQTIEQNAATNLADLLNQNLNISIRPSNGTAKSQVSLFGLDGQYFKVLIDGIPMVSEDGFGNNIDLTQINLDHVKQIEIVEGSMGVSYGANAVSGVINIITKTSIQKKWAINFAVQEETVGDEYEWWAKGRHIQDVEIAHKISNKLYASVNFNRNHFRGFQGEREGIYYIGTDGKRGLEWLPKEQINTGTVLKWKKNNLSLSYKFRFLKELLNDYNHTVESEINPDLPVYDRFANDRDYRTKRYSNELILNTKIKNQVNLHTALAYKKQKKEYRDYLIDLYSRETDYNDYNDFLSRDVIFAKATASNFFNNDRYNFQIGTEYNNVKGFGSAIANNLNQVDQKNTLANTDVFFSSEYKVNDKLSFRPGMRYSFQTEFDNQASYSIGSKYLFKNNLEWRASFSSGFVYPQYDQLFTVYIAQSHDIFGNENLVPEKSISVNTYFKKQTFLKNKVRLTNKLKLRYLDVMDKISLAIVENPDKLTYQYTNISSYKSFSLTSENNIRFKNFNISLGATIQGISEEFRGQTEVNNDYLFTTQANANITYKIPKINTSLNFIYKYNGKQNRINTDFEKETTKGYSWSDISIKKGFYDKRIEMTVGARNLFDITNLESITGNSSGVVHGSTNNIPLGYGRSYFLKFKYNLDI